tara:strand:- start:1716 stop:3194 length:1479 start_codon:yes stop_codon:yes gene_type:complete
MQLLEDVFIIEKLQVINEGTGSSGPMKVRGVFQRADEANNNKRIYRRPLLEREVTKLAEAMNERRLMGELDHPQHDSVKLSNVSHLITGLSMKGNEVIGEAEILNTPAGKVAQALIEGGVKIGISSRGMGTVTEEVDGKRYVNEDFRLITWDIVADPSTRGAYPGLTESTQIQEIIDRVYPEAQKVKNFTTLLKEELITEIVAPRKPAPAPHRGPGKPKPTPFTPKPTGKPIPTPPNPKPTGKPEADDNPFSREKNVQNSSSQFVNFMRDKLMETTTAYAEIEARRAKLDKTIKYSQAQKKKAEAKKNESSSQFVNYMRDRLEEKTRLQKETEKRSKKTKFGRVAKFKTSGGKTETVQDYKASRSGGAGSQAHSLAVELEELPIGHPKWKQHAKRVKSGKGRKGKLARGAQEVRNVRMERDGWRGAQNKHGKVRALSLKNKAPKDVLSRSRRDSKEGGAVSPASERQGSMARRRDVQVTGPESVRSPGTLPK